VGCLRPPSSPSGPSLPQHRLRRTTCSRKSRPRLAFPAGRRFFPSVGNCGIAGAMRMAGPRTARLPRGSARSTSIPNGAFAWTSQASIDPMRGARHTTARSPLDPRPRCWETAPCSQSMLAKRRGGCDLRQQVVRRRRCWGGSSPKGSRGAQHPRDRLSRRRRRSRRGAGANAARQRAHVQNFGRAALESVRDVRDAVAIRLAALYVRARSDAPRP
jgi:hypothetical protein